MRVLVAALADHASISQPGDKLNVNGIFNTVSAPGFPLLLPAASLALRIQLAYEDRKSKHKMEVVIVNQDGKEFAKVQGNVEVPEIPPGELVTINDIILLQQLVFKGPDKFSIVIRWDEDEKQRLPLHVVAIPTSPPDAGG
jgi:hypothetical protein